MRRYDDCVLSECVFCDRRACVTNNLYICFREYVSGFMDPCSFIICVARSASVEFQARPERHKAVVVPASHLSEENWAAGFFFHFP
jgi:hypothetical protein